MMSKDLEKKFSEILESYIELEYSQVLEAMKKAYMLGRIDRKLEEYSKSDNPYHIDYERQTKLFD